jgi:hypothetical protein
MPSAALQIELPQLRHVARIEMQIAPAVIAPLRIGRPRGRPDVERLEQMLLRELQEALAGLRRDRR